MPMIAATKTGLGTVRSVRMPLPALHYHGSKETYITSHFAWCLEVFVQF